MSYVWVALGGALGSVARFWASGLVAEHFGKSFPIGTLFVNVTGSFIIGLLAGLVTAEGRLNSETRVFLTEFFMVGVCGGYTTFSSFSLETLNLLREREWLHAGGNVLFSVTLCMLTVWVGWYVGSMFTGKSAV